MRYNRQFQDRFGKFHRLYFINMKYLMLKTYSNVENLYYLFMSPLTGPSFSSVQEEPKKY